MSPTLTTKLLVVGGIVVGGIGIADSAIDRAWDALVLFAISAAISLVLLARLESRRPAIPIRRDLVAWLRERALVSGESLGVVVDRALSAYRARYGRAPSSAEPRDE